MKTVAFSVLFVILSLTSVAQTDSTKANTIISSILSLDSKKLSSHMDPSGRVNIAINDCSNKLDYTPVKTITNPTLAAQETIEIVKKEIGSNFILTWADCVDFPYYKDTPIAIVFILQNSSGERIKINVFVTSDFKIGDITIYQNSCNHF
jgi:hypothetical protein